MNDIKTKEIGSFTDFFKATLAKEILESNEINCIITGSNMSIIETVPGAEIKLIVNENQVEKAEALLISFFS
jgi:hypothetical protein